MKQWTTMNRLTISAAMTAEGLVMAITTEGVDKTEEEMDTEEKTAEGMEEVEVEEEVVEVNPPQSSSMELTHIQKKEK